MTDDLEARLRQGLAVDADRAPEPPSVFEPTASPVAGTPRRRRWPVLAVAAAVVVIGIVGMVVSIDRDTPPTVTDRAVTDPADTDRGVDPAPAPPATPASTPSPPTTAVSVSGELRAIALGDSIMLGAAEELADAGFVVDALASRQFVDLLDVVAALPARGDGGVVVLHAGSNGTIRDTYLDTVLDQLADARVVLVTSAIERGWTAANNELLRTAAAERANVELVDWGAIAGGGPGECFMSDGVHLTADGARYYTSLISEATTRKPAGDPVSDDLPLLAFRDGTCLAQATHGDPASREQIAPWNLFARGLEVGMPMHAVGDPTEGAAGPFALVLRYFEPRQPARGTETVRIDGIDIHVSVYDDLDSPTEIGNGQVEWDLPDGSQGYIRSRGLGRDDLLSIVANLTPRAADAAMPGFDYDASGTQPERLSLLVEGTNDALGGFGYGLTCTSPVDGQEGFSTRVTVADGAGVGVYALVLDRHRPAWVVRRGDAIVVGGLDASSVNAAPDRLESISEDEWRAVWSPNVGATSFGPEGGVMPRIGAVGQPDSETTPIVVSVPDPNLLRVDLTGSDLRPDADRVEVRVDEQLVGTATLDASRVVEAGIDGSGAAIVLDVRVLDSIGDVVQQTGPTVILRQP